MQDVRIRFRKTGRARYISHLDLTRAMARALRRAGLPIWYTEGFNKHPYLTFAAPLSLGFEGERESMDIRLVEEVSMGELTARLNAVLPEGLTVLEAGVPVHKAGEIAAARYRIEVGDSAAYLNAFCRREVISVEKRTKKGGTKILDLKPWLKDAVWSPLPDDRCAAELMLPCSSEETINPALILAAYEENSQSAEISFLVTRLDLLCKDGRSFS